MIKGLLILIVVADLLCFKHLFVLKFWGISLVRYLGRFHGFDFEILIVGPTIPF